TTATTATTAEDPAGDDAGMPAPAPKATANQSQNQNQSQHRSQSPSPSRSQNPSPTRRLGRAAVAACTFALLAALPHSTGGGGVEWPWPLPPSASSPPAVGPGAAGCRGEQCAGRAPEPEGCLADARVLGRHDRRGHRVQLFHSPGCRAAWGEVDPPRGTDGLTVSAPDFGQRREPSGAARTRMVPVVDSHATGVQVCALVNGGQICVAAHDRSWSD
ncbi:DUF2690 domain-containing protein, partial [Streptomyces alkaliterrae]